MSNCAYYDQPEIAELYDLIPAYSSRVDVQFYIDLCRAGAGHALELGCGTGRVLLPIASSGVNVVGLDSSEHMLEKCRAKVAGLSRPVQDRIQLVQGTMADFQLDATFDTVIIPFRTFQHLVAVTDQLGCLRCVNAHLEPGGRVAFDCFQVDMQRISDPRRFEENEDAVFELPDGRKVRRCSRFTAMHPASQYNDVEVIYYITDGYGKTDRVVHSFPFRYFFPAEVAHLLARAGFEIENVYGDFDRSPFQDDSPNMIFVAKKIDSSLATSV